MVGAGAVTMWRYPGPSCSDHSFSAELDDKEIDTQVRMILALRVHQSSGPFPIPLVEGVISPWVSPLKLILALLCRFLPSPLFFPMHVCA
jgi:hypothetical protein